MCDESDHVRPSRDRGHPGVFECGLERARVVDREACEDDVGVGFAVRQRDALHRGESLGQAPGARVIAAAATRIDPADVESLDVWGFRDTAFRARADGVVELTGTRYDLAGQEMPDLLEWVQNTIHPGVVPTTPSITPNWASPTQNQVIANDALSMPRLRAVSSSARSFSHCGTSCFDASRPLTM